MLRYAYHANEHVYQELVIKFCATNYNIPTYSMVGEVNRHGNYNIIIQSIAVECWVSVSMNDNDTCGLGTLKSKKRMAT